MQKKVEYHSQSFLTETNDVIKPSSLIALNLILNGLDNDKKPYKIDYNALLISYNQWKGESVDEFCYQQVLSYFLFNPDNATEAAREALFFEIREFIIGS